MTVITTLLRLVFAICTTLADVLAFAVIEHTLVTCLMFFCVSFGVGSLMRGAHR